MAFVHSKTTVVTLDGEDLSEFGTSVEFNREVETHDTTTFGKNSKTYAAGLKDGTATLEGIYDNTAVTGPSAIIGPLFNSGEEAEFVYQPEGLGTGKPTRTVSVIVSSFNENAPVNDMVQWTAEFQFTGDVAETSQSA